MIKRVTITGSGQITLPAELRHKHGLKAGDQVTVIEDSEGRIEVIPRGRSARDLVGIFKLQPGVEADPDFGNVIREAMDEAADRLVAQLNDPDAW